MRLSRADCTSAMEVKETVFFEYKRMHAQGVVVGVERMGCACKHASTRVLDVTQIPALRGDAGSIGFVDPRSWFETACSPTTTMSVVYRRHSSQTHTRYISMRCFQ